MGRGHIAATYGEQRKTSLTGTKLDLLQKTNTEMSCNNQTLLVRITLKDNIIILSQYHHAPKIKLNHTQYNHPALVMCANHVTWK